MKNTIKIIGPCSKWIDGAGWVTEVPIAQIEALGYKKLTEEQIIIYKTKHEQLWRLWSAVLKYRSKGEKNAKNSSR